MPVQNLQACRDPNSGLPACVGSTLPIKPSGALVVLPYSLQGGEGLLAECSGNVHSKSDSVGLN